LSVGLDVEVEPDEDVRYLSVSDIMEVYGLRKSYVYKLACIHKWRRIYGDRAASGRPYARYHIDDIDKVLGSDVG
jgi:hypothetical protein